MNITGIKQGVILVTITPELAAKWLANATSNRSIAKRAVDRYARDMGSNRWETNGETIKFTGEIGVGLIDGRHRLTACTQSGRPFVSYCACGITNFTEIDIGRRRTLADAVHIFGNGLNVPFCRALDGAVHNLLSYAKESGGTSQGHGKDIGGAMSHREKLDFILNNKILVDILPHAEEYLVSGTPLRPSIAVTICWLAAFANVPLENVHGFLRGVRDGTELSNGNPALAYRNFLLNSFARKRLVTIRESLRAAISALNNHIAGKCMKESKVPSHVEFRGASPQHVREALGVFIS